MISEDELAQLLALNPDAVEQRNAAFKNRSALVQRQLAQAQAKMQTQPESYSSPLGAMFGGLAGALQSARGGREEKQALEQLGQIDAEQNAATKLDSINRARVLKRALEAQMGGNSPSGEGSPVGGMAPPVGPGGAPGGNRIGRVSAAGPAGVPPDALDALMGAGNSNTALLAKLLRSRPGAELLAATGDPALSKFGGQQITDLNRADAQAQDDREYARGRTDKLADVADERKYQRGRDAAQNAAAEKRARIMAAAKEAEKAQGAQVPAGEAGQVGQYDAALQMLDGLEKERHDKTGMLSGIAQYLPGTSAAEYSDAVKQAAQTIGTILEGGKLTDADLDKYAQMLPSAGDGAERAAEKVRRIREAIQSARAAKISGLKAGGFNTSGFSAPTSTQSGGAAPKNATAEDLNALFGVK
jgi:hypothetical protein